MLLWGFTFVTGETTECGWRSFDPICAAAYVSSHRHRTCTRAPLFSYITAILTFIVLTTLVTRKMGAKFFLLTSGIAMVFSPSYGLSLPPFIR